MKIKRLVIENFKSIERIELVEPNPFTVFVGPNGSGKSNIFEALEFHVTDSYSLNAARLYGGADSLQNRRLTSASYSFNIVSDTFSTNASSTYIDDQNTPGVPHWVFGNLVELIGASSNRENYSFDVETNERNYRAFVKSFSKIFIRSDRQKLNYNDNSQLNLSCSNLEKVLRRILADDFVRGEIFEWLELFVPSFKAVEIDDRDELHWFEQSTPDYFTKNLISDGTYNILALLTAVYQSDEPQFLCIEEPENGLNPKVVKELVNLCRYACEEHGHFIWLNTHSQSLVSALTSQEIVLVDKVEGATRVKQIQGMNLHGLPMDEAWLSNALGGGLPW